MTDIENFLNATDEDIQRYELARDRQIIEDIINIFFRGL